MMGGGGSMMGGGGGFGILGVLGILPMLLQWGLIIFGVVLLIRYFSGVSSGGNKGRSSLDILKERYAKGEINKKEFEKMKKDLV